MVPPNLVKAPKGPMFCRVVALFTAAATRPAPPRIPAEKPALRMASLGWYGWSWSSPLGAMVARRCTEGARGGSMWLLRVSIDGFELGLEDGGASLG